ncbi:MAG: hypothetical protein HXX08_11470 [Chloroflexi bacterium]|uniref:Response regulatory domain-containing protein n=1 Tax=Candidatus Chlorohelix allophototropha TaxID=3003348 RepID=A0A8T7M298_9CHLR|nr:hypothetical protein [Chloroflexota bacterium]WJW65857.1 hypothetical protein OZ401_001636 [Chloroflexota bacterium L227-S17]
MVVLVINETAILRKALRRFFELQGYTMIEAGNFGQAYSMAIEYKPQFVLADNLIEATLCLNFFQLLQSIPGMEMTEFVVFTDYDDEFETAASINLKATITKPNILPKMREHFPPLH